MPKRAIGIVRVSEVGDREGESFASPDIQADRIREACDRDGHRLVQTHTELDISGGKPLDKRPGLRQAVEAVERGDADLIMVAYFDRLVRSLKVQQEVVERVEQAGGEVLTLDFGKLTNGTAVERLTGHFIGAVAQFFREQGGEKSAEAQVRAIARGVAIGPVPPGYQRGPGKVYAIDPARAPIVQQAFAMRADGASVEAVRSFLAEHGINRTQSGVRKMLASRLYLGEIHYGKMAPNLHAHDPLIDRAVFERARGVKASPGRKAKSERLLARLSVLRCGSCDARMVVGTQTRNGAKCYPFYYCQNRDCSRRVAIQAHIVERVVSDAVRDALRDAQGRASMAENAQDATRALESAQAGVDAYLSVLALSGAENEPRAVEHLTDLIRVRDEAQARVDQIRPTSGLTIDANADWESLSLGARRDLIRATVERAAVAPNGRGAERIAVLLVGQEPAGFGV